MKLEGGKWDNTTTKSVEACKQYPYLNDKDLTTISLADLKKKIDWAIKNVELNHKNPENIPVFLNYNNEEHTLSSISICDGNDGLSCTIDGSSYNKLIYIAPDIKPENGGEYWESRGCGGTTDDPDCSGFIKSKAAGERMMRYVKYILGTDTPKSWLDYREREPDWIQFKFSGLEFDIQKLDKLSHDNNGVITEQMIADCKI